MTTRSAHFTTIRTEGALLPADLLQRIGEGANLDGLTPQSYHRSGEKLNEAINRAWNALQGTWASFRAAQERLPENDLGTSLTRERWLLPLFRELDYGRLQSVPAVEIEGRTYAISHRWENVPIHLVSYKLDLDRRTPGAAGASSASPHSLLQVFLNRSQDTLWGFVSNGCKLRILRDNASLTRQAFVEFDLETMMTGELYSDFVLLWLLCHQSRVEAAKPADCWLEKWMKVAQDQGTRALDQLRDGVEAAITALGLGFLEHPANHTLRDQLTGGALSGQDYYRQLLRLVYRLLFLFVAEDRDLLLKPEADAVARARYTAHYSTQRLRQMAARFRGTQHPDLYEGLRLVMRLLSGENDTAGAPLGLAPLGSFLFSDGAIPAIVDCQIANVHLLEAIRALSQTYDSRAQVFRSVDYRNLGPEELGSVYESLLELHPQINVPARRFALAAAGGNERKTTGSYYTPTSLINALLDSALEPVLDNAAKAGESRLLALKICDPACGSGHFLIAAANRIAKRLAMLRTGEEEPSPAAIQQAKRDVIGHCIYGVDINPMAVELCKVNLWMEALEPGKPLSFLDHRIQCGNSLIGTTPRLMAGGIPDGAFNPIEGDDKARAGSAKTANRKERREREKLESGQTHFLHLFEPHANYRAITDAARELDSIDDDTLAGMRRKAQAYAELEGNPERQKAQILADAWCAAFVWEKRAQNALPPMTDLHYRSLEKAPLDPRFEAVRRYVQSLQRQYQCFHWHIAFPDVFRVPDDPNEAGNAQTGWNGGFDCVLGNPPWEHIEVKEKEWFAERLPEIASASGVTRKKLISALQSSDEALFALFQLDLRKVEAITHFVRTSARYPLTAHGRTNTYPLFAESSRHILAGTGRMGIIVPSGIATDDTTKFFFQDLMQTRTLASLYDFENRAGLFRAVDSRMKFCLLTVAGQALPVTGGAQFVFFALDPADLADAAKRFTLSAEDIRLLNPNTGTTATFRSQRDAEITKAIYRLVPILMHESPALPGEEATPAAFPLPHEGEGPGMGAANPWGITFRQGLFNMTSDSHLFRTREQLEAQGLRLEGNRFVGEGADSPQPPSPSPKGRRGEDSPLHLGEGLGVRASDGLYLPLYEAKMMHQYDHRTADVVISETALIRQGQPSLLSNEEHNNPYRLAMPRYWVSYQDVEQSCTGWGQQWLLGWRDVTSVTNERTLVSSIIPRVGAGDKFLLVVPSQPNSMIFGLTANLASLCLDYCSRQKVGGTSFKFYLFRQLPVLPPHTYTPALLDFIVPRVLELTYTAWDLQPFAQDVGWQGAPFVWDEDRRFLMRCELDALYFHLYQIARPDVEYILDTFPIVRRKDEARYGEYRTQRVILEMYDQMAALPQMNVPHPKSQPPDSSSPLSTWERGFRGEGQSGEGYLVPDVSQFRTWLNPPPADPSVAHPED